MRVGRPSSAAVSSAASRQDAAPSVSGAAVPAVTRPPARNGVGSFWIASTVVPGRGGSSAVARPQPFSGSRSATGTRSGSILPAASAAAYLSWLATPYASARSRVSAGNVSCRFSAVTPMLRASLATSRSDRNRGFGSASKPIGWWPMCSTPPASATSCAPTPIAAAVLVTAVIAPAHMRSIA